MAWWAWAAGLAICDADNNPFLLALSEPWPASSCRPPQQSPWSRSFAFFLRIGVLVIVIRVVIEILFGSVASRTWLFTMPQVPLPSWAAAVSIGGAVTLESIVNAAVEGLQIAVILVCFGAANSLVSPYRLLRWLPAVLYEAGVAVTVALSFTPELVETIGSVRQARRIRGIPTRGLRGMRGIAVPFWRARSTARCNWPRRWTLGATAGDTDGNASRRSPAEPPSAASCWPQSVSTGSSMPARSSAWDCPSSPPLRCSVRSALPSGDGAARSRYRPDRWRQPEWLVVGSGLVALVTMAIAHALRVPA